MVRTPTGWVVVCGNGGSGPGGPGAAAAAAGAAAGAAAIPASSSRCRAGYPDPYPAPKGDKWMWLVCQVTEQTGIVLVPTGSTTANPGVTPQELLQWALAELVRAAPRAGHRAAAAGMPGWSGCLSGCGCRPASGIR